MKHLLLISMLVATGALAQSIPDISKLRAIQGATLNCKLVPAGDGVKVTKALSCPSFDPVTAVKGPDTVTPIDNQAVIDAIQDARQKVRDLLILANILGITVPALAPKDISAVPAP